MTLGFTPSSDVCVCTRTHTQTGCMSVKVYVQMHIYLWFYYISSSSSSFRWDSGKTFWIFWMVPFLGDQPCNNTPRTKDCPRLEFVPVAPDPPPPKALDTQQKNCSVCNRSVTTACVTPRVWQDVVHYLRHIFHTHDVSGADFDYKLVCLRVCIPIMVTNLEIKLNVMK